MDLQVRVSRCCWRTPMIQELIYQKFGVLYSVKYLVNFLKIWGFHIRKPVLLWVEKTLKIYLNVKCGCGYMAGNR